MSQNFVLPNGVELVIPGGGTVCRRLREKDTVDLAWRVPLTKDQAPDPRRPKYVHVRIVEK